MAASRGTAGIYARISIDRPESATIDRQLADCQTLADEHDWTTEPYIDRGKSAYQLKRRPEWDRLLGDIEAGHIRHVIAWHPDRLYRRLQDLERLIDLCETSGCTIHTVKAGAVDVSTASGRMVARLMGATQRHESERTGERVKSAKDQRAHLGLPAGGGLRAFGLTQDRTALVPDEAAALRHVVDSILSGASYGSQVAWLNETGVLTSRGNQWTTGTLTKVLTSPHVAGYRTQGSGKQRRIVADASWPAIIDRDKWDLLMASRETRTVGRPPSPKRLLSGLLVCGQCGLRLYATRDGRPLRDAYACKSSPTTSGRGCGGVSIAASLIEPHVSDLVRGWLADPVFAAELESWMRHGETVAGHATAELEEVRRRLALAAERWAAGDLSDGEYEAARGVLVRRESELRPQVVGMVPRLAAGSPKRILALWDRAPVEQRRAILAELAATPIRVHKGRGPERIDLHPVWRD